MIAKAVFTICTLFLFAQAKAQSDAGIVSNIEGFYIFTESRPIAEHDVVGEVFTSAHQDARIIESKGQYGPIRDFLIGAAKKVSESADGLILTVSDRGQGKASIIKFRQASSDNARSTVNQVKGVYVFIDSSPIAARQYLGTTVIRGKTKNVQFRSVLENLIALSTKDHPEVEGIVLRFGFDGSISADMLDFNWKQ